MLGALEEVELELKLYPVIVEAHKAFRNLCAGMLQRRAQGPAFFDISKFALVSARGKSQSFKFLTLGIGLQ
jgi:hypothetical protein